jgi:hypothetical protein
MGLNRLTIGIAVLTWALAAPSLALGQQARPGKPAPDRYDGYYYPKLSSQETYRARAAVNDNATREARLAFLAAMSRGQLQQPYHPSYTIFAKGEHADRMMIVALNDEGFRTLFQARALLALLTNVARTTDLFQNMAVDDFFTFFDLARLLGFTTIVVSDGNSFAHRINLE